MRSIPWLGALTTLALALASPSEEPWSRFRGPNGSGVAAGESYPVRLDPEANAAWRSEVRPGKSSPVLTDSQIFLTAWDADRLYTQCFDRETGRLLWERGVERSREADLNQLNEPAAISPVTDGENVYVFFRDIGLLSYSGSGDLRWRAPLGPFANSMGQASSPLLAAGRLIVQADQKQGSYIAALDPATGETVWMTPREEGEGWSTPVLHGDAEVITTSRGWLAGHGLRDGRRLWGVQALSPAIIASPAAAGDTVHTFGYGNESLAGFERGFDAKDQNGDARLTLQEIGTHPFMTGVAKYDGDRDGELTRQEYLAAAGATIAPSMLFAFRFDESGAPRELWRYERSFIGVIPSPLVYRGVLYWVKNGGILESLDAETGEALKRGRLRDAIGGYSASPVAAGGWVYLASEEGSVTTLAAGGDWQVAATSRLGEPIFATPALSDGQVFLRTGKALYCFRGAGR